MSIIQGRNERHHHFLVGKGTVNTNKIVFIVVLAAQRLLRAIVTLSSYKNIQNISVNYHLLLAVIGLQLRPRGTTVSVGIPTFLATSAPWSELEFWRLLQQYSSAIHLAELSRGKELLMVDKESPSAENIP